MPTNTSVGFQITKRQPRSLLTERRGRFPQPPRRTESYSGVVAVLASPITDERRPQRDRGTLRRLARRQLDRGETGTWHATAALGLRLRSRRVHAEVERVTSAQRFLRLRSISAPPFL